MNLKKYPKLSSFFQNMLILICKLSLFFFIYRLSRVSSREATPCALLQKEALQRQQRRSVAPTSQRRSANSVAAWIPRRSVAASQHQQCRSVAPVSQRLRANSVAALIPRRRVAAPTVCRSAAAASQPQQRRSVTGPTAASQRRSVAASQHRRPLAASQHCSTTRPPERRSVERHPPLGASQRNVGNPRFGPLGPSIGNLCKLRPTGTMS